MTTNKRDQGRNAVEQMLAHGMTMVPGGAFVKEE